MMFVWYEINKRYLEYFVYCDLNILERDVRTISGFWQKNSQAFFDLPKEFLVFRNMTKKSYDSVEIVGVDKMEGKIEI